MYKLKIWVPQEKATNYHFYFWLQATETCWGYKVDHTGIDFPEIYSLTLYFTFQGITLVHLEVSILITPP